MIKKYIVRLSDAERRVCEEGCDPFLTTKRGVFSR